MKDIISSDLSDKDKNEWKTDKKVFDALNNEFNFDLDAAASDDNHLCANYFTKHRSALTNKWDAKTVFINPPYGRWMIKKFMDRCVEEKENGVTSVLLVPNTIEASWLPIDEISEIRLIVGGRLSFRHPITNKKISGNTKGSMIVIIRPSKMPCSVRLISREELLNENTNRNNNNI